jgi:hypothetical protein
VNSGESTPLPVHSELSNVVVCLGTPPKAAASRTADRPIRPTLLLVQGVHHLDGTGLATRAAAFLTNPTLPLRNALMGGNGPGTSASQSQPLHLLKTLNLLTTITAMAGSVLKGLVPTRPRSPVLGHRRSRLLHN